MKQDGKYVGYCIDLLEELKNLMNFEYELMEAPDGQYGRMNEQAEWNGMVKELMEKVRVINLLSTARTKISWSPSFIKRFYVDV